MEMASTGRSDCQKIIAVFVSLFNSVTPSSICHVLLKATLVFTSSEEAGKEPKGSHESFFEMDEGCDVVTSTVCRSKELQKRVIALSDPDNLQTFCKPLFRSVRGDHVDR